MAVPNMLNSAGKKESRGKDSLMNEEKLRGRVQVIAQLTGVLAVAIYGGGFLAMSLHHASFGISQFNLLRPKIISAGVLFFVFASLPVIETIQIFGFPTTEVTKTATDASTISAKSRASWTDQLGLLLIALIGSSLILRQFLSDSPPTGSFYAWSLAAVVPSAAILTVVPFLFRKERRGESAVRATLFVLVALWMIFCIYRTRDTTFTVLIGWFLFCSYIFYQIRGALKEDRKLQKVNWVQAVTLAMGTAAFFGVQVYPRIPSGFGGGYPTQATLQFADKSPFDGAAKSRVWFIDETELGFYVIKSKDAKKAIFLPRNAVSVIYFGEEPEQSKTEQPKKEPVQNPAGAPDARLPSPTISH
jgi:hypothetical protein